MPLSKDDDAMRPMATGMSRRAALRLGSMASLGAAAVPAGIMGALAGGASSTAQAAAGDDTSTPLGRLKIALRDAKSIVRTYDPLVVVQGQQNCADPIGGAGSFMYPQPLGYSVNPNPATLADLPQIWGHRRDTWTRQAAGYINSASGQYASWYSAVSKTHRAQTTGNNIPCGLHFIHTGQAFEVLFAGRDVFVTLVADSRYMSFEFISKTTPGAPLSLYNTVTRFDFGYPATRHISVYAGSSQGPCGISIGARDTIVPWVRDTEPSFFAMADSYGSGRGFNWFMGGPFWEAASLLGIPHIDLSSIGGTGYAPNNTNADTRLQGNTFRARVSDSVTAAPDLFLTAGGINDNNSFAAPPLYGTAAQALAAFNDGVRRYYVQLRTALPNSVLAAMGPWVPRESIPPNPVELSKLETIKASLAAVGGPWVFLDNMRGGWINSAGASSPQTGRGWQTGTGNVATPKGDGNADIYISADGTHPSNAGHAYLGQVLADNLRAAILAL